MLIPMTGHLHDLGYVGYCDVSVIVDAKGNPWPMEFTMRPGWPCFNIQQALHKGDPATWMLDLINGFDTLQVSDKVATGIVLTVPDFPYCTKTKEELSGIPIYGITEKNINDMHPCDIQLAKDVPQMNGDKLIYDDCWVSAGEYLLTVTGTDKSVEGSINKTYKTIKDLEVPSNLQYITDIGKRMEKQLDELHKWGYAEETEY